MKKFLFIFLILMNTASLYALSFGPDQILQCPVDGNIHKVRTIRSYNTLGGQYWTDGFATFPMAPSFPHITKCGKCGTYLWREEFTIIGEMPFSHEDEGNLPIAWQEAEYIRFLTLDEYFEAIEKGKADTDERELYIRIKIWWAINDQIRNRIGEYTVNPILGNDVYVQNLLRVIKLLENDSSPESFLRRAEAYRELGRFGAATRMLNRDFDRGYLRAVREIKKLIWKKDTIVRRLFLD